jgi:hypothetical protein
MSLLEDLVAVKDDVRYCEFLFLCETEKHPLKWVNVNDAREQQAVGLQQTMYAEMVMSMLEDLYVHPNQGEILGRARQVRRETLRNPGIARHDLFTKLISGLYQFRITDTQAATKQERQTDLNSVRAQWSGLPVFQLCGSRQHACHFLCGHQTWQSCR